VLRLKSSCKKFKNSLIDVYYSEKILDRNLKHHLETCEECRKFYEELNDTKENLKILENDIEIDYSLISGAFDKAEEIQSKRKSIIELILFIVISTSILITVGYIVSIGYGMLILKLQLAIFFIVPFLTSFILSYKYRCTYVIIYHTTLILINYNYT